MNLELPATVERTVDMYSNGGSFGASAGNSLGVVDLDAWRTHALWFKLMRPVPPPDR